MKSTDELQKISLARKKQLAGARKIIKELKEENTNLRILANLYIEEHKNDIFDAPALTLEEVKEKYDLDAKKEAEEQERLFEAALAETNRQHGDILKKLGE